MSRWRRKAEPAAAAAPAEAAAEADDGFWDEEPCLPPAPAPAAAAAAPCTAAPFVAAAPAATTPALDAAAEAAAAADAAAALEEERSALEAIYGEEFEVVGPAEWRVELFSSPAGAAPAALRLLLPAGYPGGSDPPVPILDCESRSPTFQALAGSAIEELVAEYVPAEEGCIIQWVEHLRAALQPALEEAASVDTALRVQHEELVAAAADAANAQRAVRHSAGFTYMPANPQYGQRQRHFDAASDDPANAVEIRHGEPIVDRKSTFIAHGCRVSTEAQVQWALRELLSDRKVAVATHNMFAYRFWDGGRNVQVADNDDDGEDGAGTKMAQLLSLASCEGVLVMVSRWYGGIQLGPDRFKHISRATTQLLDAAGWSTRGRAGPSGGGRGKR